MRRAAGFLLIWLVIAIAGCAQPEESLPSDSALRARFERIRSELDEIRRMSDEDASVIRIGPDFTWLETSVAWPRPEAEWGISRERWDAYRSLFERIGCADGLLRRDGNLYITCGTRGMFDGAAKGYAYVPQVDPRHVVPELESPRAREGRPYFARLAGEWFLFVD